MDKKILSQVSDEQKRLAISKIIDTANLASKHFEAKFSHFLDPATAYFVQKHLHFDADLQVRLWGGYEGAERQVLCCAPEWTEVTDELFPVACIEAQGSAFHTLSHRDYLGALMGLGITREQIGDIAVEGETAYLFCKADIAPYILQNMHKVGADGVKLKRIACADATIAEEQGAETTITVASLRLDAVLAGALNISRAAGAELVKSCRVQVNFEPCVNLSRILSCGDLISVRGFGRLKIRKIEGTSRKGRTFLCVARFG